MAGYSSEINPIESIWSVLKDEIHEDPITTQEQLTEHLCMLGLVKPNINQRKIVDLYWCIKINPLAVSESGLINRLIEKYRI